MHRIVATRSELLGLVLLSGALAACGGPAFGADGAPRSIDTDRVWDVLPAPSATSTARSRLLLAGARLGERRIELAGVSIDGPRLVEVARATPDDRLDAGLRDALGRPIDAGDFLYFLDDVLRTDAAGRRDDRIFVTSGRARRHGILLHPDDVFHGRPRRYGEHGPLAIDEPEAQRIDLPPAADGDGPGPGWAMRYPNPLDEEARLAALTRRRGDPDLERRVRRLVAELREQGAEVSVESTVRRPERGYLMWGAFLLSRVPDPSQTERTIARLDRANREWGLEVPIDWDAAGDWRATREAAREMAETYSVVHATEAGARTSSHYDGRAVDLVAVDLPRGLTLTDDAGRPTTFDLSGPEEPLDLGLTPALIDWIEANLDLVKLRDDHPHWDDAR